MAGIVFPVCVPLIYLHRKEDSDDPRLTVRPSALAVHGRKVWSLFSAVTESAFSYKIFLSCIMGLLCKLEASHMFL